MNVYLQIYMFLFYVVSFASSSLTNSLFIAPMIIFIYLCYYINGVNNIEQEMHQ